MIVREVIFLTINVLGASGGEMCASRAMKLSGEVKRFTPRELLATGRRVVRIGWMWLGVALMISALFALLALLSWENVSFIVPATAISYVVAACGGKFLLGEQISLKRWIGVLLVCLGVMLVWIG